MSVCVSWMTLVSANGLGQRATHDETCSLPLKFWHGHQHSNKPQDRCGRHAAQLARMWLKRSTSPFSMSVLIEVETSAWGSAWVSDLALRDVASGFAGALDSGSACESGLPKRTSITLLSATVSSSSSGSPSSVMSVKCRGRPSRTASVNSGINDVTVSMPLWSRASPACDCN